MPESPPSSGRTSADDWVAIGQIVGAFGIRGDVKVQPLTDFPDRFARTPRVYVGAKRTPHAVSGARPHGRLFVLHLAGVETATDAQKLRHVALYIPAAEISPLPADQYYQHDLIGLRVEHVDGRPLGVISDVIATGGNDLLVVRPAEGGRETLLPAVKEFVKAVDVAGGVVRVDPIPGLFDENAEISDEANEPDGPDDGEGDH